MLRFIWLFSRVGICEQIITDQLHIVPDEAARSAVVDHCYQHQHIPPMHYMLCKVIQPDTNILLKYREGQRQVAVSCLVRLPRRTTGINSLSCCMIGLFKDP